MIEVGYLVDSKGAQKFGTCASCGKGSDDDPKMVRVTYSHHDSISRTSNCLCADCRRLLLKTISDVLDRSVGEWISCSKRMPEECEWIGTKTFGTTISDEVYVTFEAPDGQRFADHINFQNGKLSRSDEQRMKVIYKGAKPIAWMPLPEPYRGGDA